VNKKKNATHSNAADIKALVPPTILVCCLFVLLISISHSVLAESHQQKPAMVAVFEDHQQQMNASKPYGLSWELVSLAARESGVDMLMVATSWQSSIIRLKNDRLDLVFAAFRNEERQQWAQFSLPLASDTSVLFSAADSEVVNLSDVDYEKDVVGVVSDSSQEALARQVGFKHIYAARVRKQLYPLLESGRIKYVLISTSSMKVYCPDDELCVQQVGTPLANNYTRIMALKGSEKASKLIRKLNEGLKAIYQRPGTQSLFKKFGYRDRDYLDWKDKFESELRF